MALASLRGAEDDQGVIDNDIRVRRVRPDDAAELERLYAELSDSSRLLRFHGRSRAVDRRAAAAFAAADHVRRDGFVAIDGPRVVGHLALEPLGAGAEELAVVVDDRAQHRGVGSLLLAAAVASARLRAIRTIVAWVMAENGAARHIVESTHRRARRFWEGPVARYEIEVPPMPPIEGRGRPAPGGRGSQGTAV
jgi:GNAT superfamily N-acetyltransferase